MTAPDCKGCGACCTTGNRGPALLQITRAEFRRLPPNVTTRASLASEARPKRAMAYYLNIKTGRCNALEGVVGFAVSCRVYDDRPNACRALVHDSPECHNARRLLGMA